MQTFVPCVNVRDCMRVLDDRRLGNQVYREGMTLIRGGWPNHPAAKMWKDYEHALGWYLIAGVDELLERGKDYRDRPWCIELNEFLLDGPRFDDVQLPPWWGDDRVHSSHRANLLRKDPEHYEQFGWTETPQEGYYWPC